MSANTVLPTIDDVLCSHRFVAATLAERADKYRSQDDDLSVFSAEVRELRAATFSAHVLATMVEYMRNDGKVGGESVSQAAIAKALRTNGKRITMVKQILENESPFSALFVKTRVGYVVGNTDVVDHIILALTAEVGGRSIETLHKRYGKIEVTVTETDETETDETDDQTETDTDSFDAVLAFATVVAACRKRGMTDQEITDVYTSVIG